MEQADFGEIVLGPGSVGERPPSFGEGNEAARPGRTGVDNALILEASHPLGPVGSDEPDAFHPIALCLARSASSVLIAESVMRGSYDGRARVRRCSAIATFWATLERVERLTDTLGRPVRDLRVSVTDRCNFRCVYCMPKEVFGRDYAFLARTDLLTFEEIARVATLFHGLGVEKLRITGGEPLVRRDLETLVSMLAGIDGLDLTLTTNGALLAGKAQKLKDAGLDRVTVSLDSLDDEVFRAMNDVDFPVDRVLAGIEAATVAGLDPVKVNVVVKRGLNEDGILDLARYFRGTGVVLRFIEYMDVGHTNGWRLDDVVPAAEIVATIDAELPVEPVEPSYRGEVARRWRYLDGSGEIGVISSVTQPFCGDCTRARLSADGQVYTCLFAVKGHDLRALLRSGATDEELTNVIADIWRARADRYSDLRSAATTDLQKVEMSYIGG
jgi:cyclic pyranopterin phosphate synthase